MGLNKKDTNSILNINITNITNTNGPPTYSSVANQGYNYNQKFFDNSVINKINQENTMISSNIDNYEIDNKDEIKKTDNTEQDKNFGIALDRKNKDQSPFTIGKEMVRDGFRMKIENNPSSTRRMESDKPGKI